MASSAAVRQRERQWEAMRRLVRQMEARDPALTSHSELVSLYATRTAMRMGVEVAQVERIGLAGVLHDVGKVVLPDSVLYKPGPLTADEWREVRRHPEAGAWIVAGAGFQDLAQWVLAHHERVDGRGYPHGVAGGEIPLEARILSVADAYEAMTTDRVYRPSIGHSAAVAELRRCAGTQFDPIVVEAFVGDDVDELARFRAAHRRPAVR